VKAAAATAPKEPELLERLGTAQFDAGDFSGAAATFQKLAALQPKSPQAQLRLADAWRAASDPTSADAAVRRAIEIAPSWPPALRANVELALREQRPSEALKLARQMQTQNPGEALGFSLEGDIEGDRKNWGAAVAAFRSAVARNEPADAPARLHWALTNAKKPADAAQFERFWIKKHPYDVGFMLHLADAAMLKSDWGAAEAGYAKVISLRPNEVIALNNLAYLRVKANKPGGVPLAERAVALAPKRAEFHDTLALAYAEDKQIDKAIESQLKAVELAPQAGGLRLNLARLYLRAGATVKARAELSRLAARGAAFSAQAEVEKLLREAGN
jgi:putative PEP-CTERM system TPR-repeat lipoprotein